MAFSALSQYLVEERDEALIGWLWKGLLLSIALASLLKVPYGKNNAGGAKKNVLYFTSITMPARLGWFIMELPALAIPLLLLLTVGGRFITTLNPNMIILSLFLIHYFNRVFIFSLTLRGRNTPVLPIIAGVITNGLNGFIQGRYLTNYARYDAAWFYDPRFIVGVLLFFTGMAINIHSDVVLRSLRAPGETTYRIPHGGFFEYVSGANYFGESLEWTGYAIASWSYIGGYLATWTVVFLGSRALQYHKFYLEKFDDYPKSRKAFIPFVL